MLTRPTLFFTTGLFSFVTYVTTLAPSISWRNNGADSGDLAAAVAVNGVPHPPGYPTYLLLGDLFELLPVGDVAYRLNLMSATCAALAVALTALIIFESLSTSKTTDKTLYLRWFCAASAGLMLAFAGIYWSQAVITEVYALNALFAALIMYGSIRAGQSKTGWLGPAIALAMGLSLGNHLSIIFFFPLAINALKTRWSRRQLVLTILAFCLGLTVYLLLPLRASAHPPINWGMANTWQGFWWLVSAQTYRSYLFGLPLEFVPIRLVSTLRFLMESFSWWGFPVGLLGLYRLARFNRTLAFTSLLSFSLFLVYAVSYDTADSFVYLLPTLLIFAVWLGWGLFDMGEALLRPVARPLFREQRLEWVFLCLPLLSLFVNFPQQNVSFDNEAYAYGQESLQSVAPNALIITGDDARTFALWYLRYGQALRPDVAVVNRNLLAYDWYRQTLRHHHHHLRLLEPNGRAVTTVSSLIERNISAAPIYLAFAEPITIKGYRLNRAKPLPQVIEN